MERSLGNFDSIISEDAGPTQDCVNDSNYVNLRKQRQQHPAHYSEDDSETFVKRPDGEPEDAGYFPNRSINNFIQAFNGLAVDQGLEGASAPPLNDEETDVQNEGIDGKKFQIFLLDLEEEVIRKHKWKQFAEALGYEMSKVRRKIRHDSKNLYQLVSRWQIVIQRTNRDPISYLYWALEAIEEQELKRKLIQKFRFSGENITSGDLQRLQGELEKQDFDVTVDNKSPGTVINYQKGTFMYGENNYQIFNRKDAPFPSDDDSSSNGEQDMPSTDGYSETREIPQDEHDDEGMPALKIERLKLEVCVGQKCVMNVNIKANPEIYAVRWLKIKNGKPVKLPECSRYSAVTVDQPSLEISNAVKSDEGVYRCQATNDYGSGRSRDIFLQIIEEPKVDVKDTPIAVAGKAIQIECTVHPIETLVSLIWFKDGQRLQTQSNSHKYNGGTLQNPSLTILWLQKTDSGNYNCVVSNATGTVSSRIVKVNVADVPEVFISAEPVVLRGSTLEVNCRIQSDIEITDVEWFKDGQKIHETSNVKTGTGKHPSLMIFNADTNDGGKYVCKATNMAGIGLSNEAVVEIGELPMLVQNSTSYTVTKRGFITLSCELRSCPKPTKLLWYKCIDADRKLVITSGTFKYSGGTLDVPSLTITSVDDNDAGHYVCCAGNRFGDVQSEKVYLKVEGEKPSIKISASTPARPNQGLTITCKMSSRERLSRFDWLKNNIVLHPYSGKYIGGTIDSPNLTICKVCKSDEGKYTCRATNQHGTGESNEVYIDVCVEIPKVSVQRKVSVLIGSSIVIECTIIGEVSKLFWYKRCENQCIHVSSFSKYQNGTPEIPSLTILKADVSDAGLYFCEAENSSGIGRSEDCMVDIQGEKPKVNIPAEISAIEGEQITIHCEIVANPPITSVNWWLKEDNGEAKPLKRFGTSGGSKVHPELTILKVQKSDRGVYMCQARNSVGDGISRHCSLVVQCKPDVKVEEKQITVGVGESVTMECRVKASSPVTKVTWYRLEDGVARALCTDSTDNTTLRPSLSIRNVQKSDMGKFVCDVTNIAGTTRSDTIHLEISTDNKLLILASEHDTIHLKNFKEDIDVAIRGSSQLRITECIFPDPVNEVFLDSVNTQLSSAKAVFILASNDFISKCWPDFTKLSNLSDCLYGSRSKIIPVMVKRKLSVPMGLKSINSLFLYNHDTYYKDALSKLLCEL